jgi:hypothetical protein
VIRGTVPLRVECAPAFNYARDPHTTHITPDDTTPGAQCKVHFQSQSLSLDLRFFAESSADTCPIPEVNLGLLDLRPKGHLGLSACCDLNLVDGQSVTFVLRIPPEAEYMGYKPQEKPSLEKAEQLGVPLDRKLLSM